MLAAHLMLLLSDVSPHSEHCCYCFCCVPQDLKPEEYTYTLTDAEVAEIIAGTDAILARGVKDEEDIKKVSSSCGTGCHM